MKPEFVITCLVIVHASTIKLFKSSVDENYGRIDEYKKVWTINSSRIGVFRTCSKAAS